MAGARHKLGDGDCGKERFGVRMQRILKEPVRGHALHALPEIHYGDLGRNMLYDGEVMRDKHIGEPHLLLEVHQKIEDLRLD